MLSSDSMSSGGRCAFSSRALGKRVACISCVCICKPSHGNGLPSTLFENPRSCQIALSCGGFVLGGHLCKAHGSCLGCLAALQAPCAQQLGDKGGCCHSKHQAPIPTRQQHMLVGHTGQQWKDRQQHCCCVEPDGCGRVYAAKAAASAIMTLRKSATTPWQLISQLVKSMCILLD